MSAVLPGQQKGDTYRLELAGVLHTGMLGRQREVEKVKGSLSFKTGYHGWSQHLQGLSSLPLVGHHDNTQLETLGQSHPTETTAC